MDIFAKVQEVILDTLSCDKESVTLEASLADDLGADSLDAVELNMALEEAFGAEELEKLKTVKDIVDYIQAHTA